MKNLMNKLAKTFGNIEQTAVRLRISRDTFYKWSEKAINSPASILNRKKIIKSLVELKNEVDELIAEVIGSDENLIQEKEDENS